MQVITYSPAQSILVVLGFCYFCYLNVTCLLPLDCLNISCNLTIWGFVTLLPIFLYIQKKLINYYIFKEKRRKKIINYLLHRLEKAGNKSNIGI